jgi:NDP-sugar pyrophosphorylase family protein
MTSVIVLCGGQGKRLGEVSRSRQKTMLPVAGIPLLERVLTEVSSAVPQAQRIVLLTGHRSQDVTTALTGWQQRIDQRIGAVAEHAPGPAGLWHLTASLPAPVLLLSGNVLLSYRDLLPRLLRQHAQDGRAVVAGNQAWRTTGHHTIRAQGATVASWHRSPDRELGEYELVDTYVLSRSVLARMRRGPDIISHTRALEVLVADQDVAFCESIGDWLHVETLADLNVSLSRLDALCPRSSSSFPDHLEPEKALWQRSSPAS